LEHGETRIAVTAERAVLASLGGGCQVPIGAHATVENGRMVHIRAVVISPDGAKVIRKEARGLASEAAAIGRVLGEQLLAEGGKQILDTVYGAEADPALRT
jgi:hydroxymethylbilane synthase